MRAVYDCMLAVPVWVLDERHQCPAEVVDSFGLRRRAPASAKDLWASSSQFKHVLVGAPEQLGARYAGAVRLASQLSLQQTAVDAAYLDMPYTL